jgi:hypothetical protein
MQLLLDRRTARPTTTGQSPVTLLHVHMSSCLCLPQNTDDACRLTKMGITPVIKTEAPAQKYSYVLFSAPPSGSQDYVGEVSHLQLSAQPYNASASQLATLTPVMAAYPYASWHMTLEEPASKAHQMHTHRLRSCSQGPQLAVVLGASHRSRLRWTSGMALDPSCSPPATACASQRTAPW